MSRKHRFLGALLASIVLLGLLASFLPGSIAEAWSNDPTQNTAICTASGNQDAPQIISDGSGGAIMAWHDDRNGNDDIYAQRVDAGGSLVPPPNTPVGSPVAVPLNSATVTLDTVTVAGDTSITAQQANPGGQIPSGFQVQGQFVDITTTATYSGPITIGLSYDPSTPNPQNLKLFHWYGGRWVDVTTSVDTANHIVYGEVNSLSWFFIGGEWVWVDDGGGHSAPAFPSIYVGIGAALGAGILAYLFRRRLAHS